MLNETFKKAFSAGGLKAGAISILAELVLVIIGFVVMGSTIIMPLLRAGIDNYGTNFADLPGYVFTDILGSMGIFLLYALVAAVLGCLISAGLLGSFETAVVKGEVTLASYWASAKRLFLSYLGYSILYGIVFAVLTFVVMLVLLFIPIIGVILGQIICTMLATAGLIPLVVLSVLKYERKNFFSDNLSFLLIYGAIVAILLYVPVVGWLLAAVLQIFYPLYLISLSREQSSAMSEEPLA
ncbi:MAG: hypothetical protein M0Z55_09485 [Peptococcaceae bacterium]|nr:hypothetical protein [Peptococcaceae bacterium]